MSENMFLRSWTNELYLWYSEVPDLNPSGISTAEYFERLKTPATTASGQPKDKFHFTFDTAAWRALSESGVETGYGIQWVLVSAQPPRRLVIAYVEPGSAAAIAGLSRGVEIMRVDGVDFVSNNDVTVINAGLFPDTAGESHTFVVRELSGSQRSVTLTSAAVTLTPVRDVRTITTASGLVGYLVFNDHIATSERGLVDAITTLRAQGVQDLILDIRYNGGGFLDIASELAYMIGGTATLGRTFERLQFSDKHPTTNPVTGRALAPTPFHSTARGFSVASGTQLPTLDLPRVYVITGSGTCSASESIINALRGIDITVYQIGATTCGKPYGFFPHDNCGTTYFSVQFQVINAKNFGDYPDGFAPQNTPGFSAGVTLPGCSVADDFSNALGVDQERRLAATLAFRDSNNQNCPVPNGFAPGTVMKPGQPLSAVEGTLLRSPARENRIITTL